MTDRANAAGVTGVDLAVSLLGLASGSADVFAFIGFHEVFTSAMTGNTALLGLAIAQGHGIAAARSVAALLGFGLGVIAGTLLYDATNRRPVRHLLAVEAACLALVVALWASFAHPAYGGPLFAMILVGAAAMGIQAVVARGIDLPGINTVVFTTTMTLILMSLTRTLPWPSRHGPAPVQPITLRQFGVLGWYVGGAVIAGLLAEFLPAALALPPLLAVLAALAVTG